MKTRFTTCTVLVLLFVSLSSFTPGTNNYPPAEIWEHLGRRKVNFGLDKDVIVVTGSEGVFSKLKLKVTAGSLNMHRMVVVYGNGTRDEINVKHNFSRGSATRVIDLQGDKRVVKKVIFWYDTKNKSRNRATLHLLGKH